MRRSAPRTVFSLMHRSPVSSERSQIAQITSPVAFALAGPLADRVFEPAMRDGGAGVLVFGPLVGTGPGAGMALMLVLFGLCGAIVGVLGYTVRAVRDAETILPDHDGAGAKADRP